jgi:hypothetical protein
MVLVRHELPWLSYNERATASPYSILLEVLPMKNGYSQIRLASMQLYLEVMTTILPNCRDVYILQSYIFIHNLVFRDWGI